MNPESSTISVIIPTYNNAKTIRETLESVLNQTFKDFEVVIINDGSTDSTLEIIQSLQDARIKVFSYKNSGACTSRNRGIENAKGEYLAFIDADDLWTIDKLELQWKALKDNPDASVAYSWTHFIDINGNFLYSGTHYGNEDNMYHKLLARNCLESGSNIMVKRNVFEKILPFDQSLFPAEDWDFYLRLAAEFKFVCVPKYQILYRVHEGSSSFNMQASETACLKVIDRAFNQAPESLQHLKRFALSTMYTYYANRILGYPSKRADGIAALRYLHTALKHNPALYPTFWRDLLKVVALFILPINFYRSLRRRLSRKFIKNMIPTNNINGSIELKSAIGKAFIIAYKESTTQLEEALTAEGFCCEVIRQEDKPEYQDFASIHRCMLNHRQAWEKAAIATSSTLIVESDFVPVVGIGRLPLPFYLEQKNVGMAWLYTCAPQLYSVTPEGYGEGFSTALVAYSVTPEGAKSLCESFVEEITEKYGTSYHNFDSKIDDYLRRKGFKNYIPFRNYGEHGGKSNPEHRRNGMSGIHHADLLYGKLAFLPPFLTDEANPQLKLTNVRLKARLKGIARLLLGKYLRPTIVLKSSTPLRLVWFAVRRHFQSN